MDLSKAFVVFDEAAGASCGVILSTSSLLELGIFRFASTWSGGDT